MYSATADMFLGVVPSRLRFIGLSSFRISVNACIFFIHPHTPPLDFLPS
jgi:hypothetical protein